MAPDSSFKMPWQSASVACDVAPDVRLKHVPLSRDSLATIVRRLDSQQGYDSVCELCSLTLCAVGLDIETARILAAGVCKSSSLCHLDVSNNAELGDAGVRALSSGLLGARSLRVLVLDAINMQDAGALNLAGAIRRGASLRTLSLQHNRVGNEGAEALGKALQDAYEHAQANGRVQLRSLLLLQNKIGDVGAKALQAAAARCSALEEVDLRCNLVTNVQALLSIGRICADHRRRRLLASGKPDPSEQRDEGRVVPSSQPGPDRPSSVHPVVRDRTSDAKVTISADGVISKTGRAQSEIAASQAKMPQSHATPAPPRSKLTDLLHSYRTGRKQTSVRDEPRPDAGVSSIGEAFRASPRTPTRTYQPAESTSSMAGTPSLGRVSESAGCASACLPRPSQAWRMRERPVYARALTTSQLTRRGSSPTSRVVGGGARSGSGGVSAGIDSDGGGDGGEGETDTGSDDGGSANDGSRNCGGSNSVVSSNSVVDNRSGGGNGSGGGSGGGGNGGSRLRRSAGAISSSSGDLEEVRMADGRTDALSASVGADVRVLRQALELAVEEHSSLKRAASERVVELENELIQHRRCHETAVGHTEAAEVDAAKSRARGPAAGSRCQNAETRCGEHAVSDAEVRSKRAGAGAGASSGSASCEDAESSVGGEALSSGMTVAAALGPDKQRGARRHGGVEVGRAHRLREVTGLAGATANGGGGDSSCGDGRGSGGGGICGGGGGGGGGNGGGHGGGGLGEGSGGRFDAEEGEAERERSQGVGLMELRCCVGEGRGAAEAGGHEAAYSPADITRARLEIVVSRREIASQRAEIELSRREIEEHLQAEQAVLFRREAAVAAREAKVHSAELELARRDATIDEIEGRRRELNKPDHARAAAEAATLLAEVSALEAVAVAGDKARAEAAAAKIGIEALSAAARQAQALCADLEEQLDECTEELHARAVETAIIMAELRKAESAADWACSLRRGATPIQQPASPSSLARSASPSPLSRSAWAQSASPLARQWDSGGSRGSVEGSTPEMRVQEWQVVQLQQEVQAALAVAAEAQRAACEAEGMAVGQHARFALQAERERRQMLVEHQGDLARLWAEWAGNQKAEVAVGQPADTFRNGEVCCPANDLNSATSASRSPSLCGNGSVRKPQPFKDRERSVRFSPISRSTPKTAAAKKH